MDNSVERESLVVARKTENHETFPAVVGPQNLNTGRELCLNVSYKGLKSSTDFTFRPKKIYPSLTT